MKKIFYVYRTARSRNLINFNKGTEPDHFLYGFNYLQKAGFKVNFSDIAYSKLNFLKPLLYPIEYLAIKKTSIGFRIDQAVILLPRLLRSDLIIAAPDSAALPILLLKKLRLLNKPIVYISIGLVNELVSKEASLFTKFYKKLFLEANVIICHSPIEVATFIKLQPKLKNRVFFIPFGIDIKYFESQTEKEKFILSVGRDRSRDYKLLSEVAKKFTNNKFVLVASKANVENIDFPKNVKIYREIPYLKVKQLYSQSKLIILPIRNLSRASGQVAFLEALAAGKIIVVSASRDLKETYPSIFKTCPNIFSFNYNSTEDTFNKISKALKAKNKPYKLPTEFSSQNYASHLIRLAKSINEK